jgi:hypothetical protein
MSTRAIYTFKGFGEQYHVFKHHDGYPKGAADAIKKALPYAWEMPRYEPDEFAAAFIAGNKPFGGGVRVAKSRTQYSDVEFGYTIYPLEHKKQHDYPQMNVGQLLIDVVSTDYWDGKKEMLLFRGPLNSFLAQVEKIQQEYDEA